MNKKRIFSLLLTLLMCVSLVPVSACATDTVTTNEFSFYIQDETGTAVNQAEIALYSFLDEKVVATGRTNAFGGVKLRYSPSLPDKVNTYHGDYLALVSKEGYSPRLHLMTKIYTGSSTDNTDIVTAINSETQIVVLSPAPASENVNTLSAEQQSISAYCQENGKLSTTSPIYVMQEEDFVTLRATGKLPQTRTTSYDYYYNKDIPLGEFHTNARCTTSVKFTSSDVVRVEAAQKLGSAFTISGSISRSFGRIIQFPDFTSSYTYGVKRTYSTQGTFAKKTVSYLSQGETYTTETVQLHEITGGVYWSTPVRCNTCSKSATDVLNGEYGTYVHLYSGSSQTHYRQMTVDFDLKAKISELSLNLGTSLSTTTNTEVKYSATGGEIYLYDVNHSGKVYHVTNA